MSAAVSFALAVAWATAAEARARDPISAAEADARISEMRVPAADFTVRPLESRVDTFEDCDEYSVDLPISDPVNGGIRYQTLFVWVPFAPGAYQVGPMPAAIIVPTIEGHSFIEDRAARAMCGGGIFSVIADVMDSSLPTSYPDWGYEDRRIGEAIRTLQTVLDWTAGDARVDARRIGALGISLGGITAALWAGVEPRLKAAMTVAAGGNLPEILSRSGQEKMRQLRHLRMRAAGFTSPLQYEEALHVSARFDPVYFADRARADVKMYSGTLDTYVPFSDHVELWRALGKPERDLIRGVDHVASIAYWAYWHLGESVAWMNAHLAL